MSGSRQSNAPFSKVGDPKVKITHPFHPLFNQEFSLVTRRSLWGENRVYFHDRSGKLISVPTSWTNLGSEDPFVTISDGRSLFRAEDLLTLSTVIEEVKERKKVHE